MTAVSTHRGLDFDEGMELARTNPSEFERRRQALIDDLIDSAPEARQERLRRLQWRIDRERELAPTPMAACARIYRMMWRSFAGPEGLAEVLRDPERLGARHAHSAQVIPFPRSRG